MMNTSRRYSMKLQSFEESGKVVGSFSVVSGYICAAGK